MAAPKRTRIQREKDLLRTAELYLKGWPQYEIAKELKVSQPQIAYDIKDLIGRWKEKAAMNIDERKAEELAKVDRLEAEYWKGWEDSRKATKVTNAQTTTAGAKPGNTISKKEITSAGDPRFLAGIAQCIEQRCKILGLHAPTKLQGSFTHDHEYTDKEVESIAAELAGRKN